MAEEPATQERINDVSADLAYELQFRTLEQLTNIGVGGAGLTITLVGGLLKNSGGFVWIAAIEFGLAALLSMAAQSTLVSHLFARTPTARSARILSLVSVVLIGMGIGSLAASVLLS